MTVTQRFATAPVVVPDRAAAPSAIDRLDPTTAWITAGQLWVAAWFVLSFGVREEGPTTLLGLNAMLGAATLVLAPRGKVGRIRLSLPVLLLAIWWALSYNWTTSTGNWWVVTKGEVTEILPPVIFAAILPFERITQALRISFYVSLAYNLVMTAASPATTTTHLDITGRVALPGWHGTFIHKNEMVFFLIIGVVTALVFEPRRWVRQLVVAVSLALTLLSRSGTGLLASILLTLLYVWLGVHRRQPDYLRRWFAGISAFLAWGLTMVLVPLVPAFLDLGGKDATLSGRSDIWRITWAAVSPQKWTGFGVGGVWMDQASEPTRSIVAQIGFTVFHAHSGPLELVMRLGLVGLALGLWMTVSSFRHAWWLQRARHDAGRWITLVMALMVITWFTENTMTGQWLGLLAMFTVLARSIREELSSTPTLDPWPVRPRDL